MSFNVTQIKSIARRHDMYLEVMREGSFSFTDKYDGAVKGQVEIFLDAIVINYSFYDFKEKLWTEAREAILSTEEDMAQFFSQLQGKIQDGKPLFLDNICEDFEDDCSQTEEERQVRVRTAQAKYRENLEKLWDGKCAVTGIECRELLRASHAKPWAECASGKERINGFNGFLLNVALDALFDKFLISFDDEGQILISAKLSLQELEKLGITDKSRLRKIDHRHLPFLHWHRRRFEELNFRELND